MPTNFSSILNAYRTFIYIYTINQQIHFYKNVQSRIIILHQHVSIPPVTFIRGSYNKNTINININYIKMYDKNHLTLHLIFL
jgi:hypothetical protein